MKTLYVLDKNDYHRLVELYKSFHGTSLVIKGYPSLPFEVIGDLVNVTFCWLSFSPILNTSFKGDFRVM